MYGVSAERFDYHDPPIKIKKEKDTKIPNTYNFRLYNEDHTLGNLIRMQLLKDPRVTFAGYKHPHPLENWIDIKLQTTESSDPRIVFNNALSELISITDTLYGQFGGMLN